MTFPLVAIVIAVAIAVSTIATTWIRARHGYPLEDDQGRPVPRIGADRAAELVSQENAQLKAMVVRLEDRVATLERIATDAPNRLSAEIERLR